jgi:hypothetical protein
MSFRAAKTAANPGGGKTEAPPGFLAHARNDKGDRMKKPLILAALVSLVAAHAFATYFVILKNGTVYKAKAKWTVANGKALISLESGQSLLIDPVLIDEAKSEQVTRTGGAGLNTIDLNPNLPQTETQGKSSLGSAFKIRKVQPAPAPTAVTVSSAPSGPLLGSDVVDKFDRAYENVGIYEKKLTATGPRSLRAELTADSEEKVFNAISATSFLIMRNAGVNGARVDLVELFMKTTTGGSSGRFQMTRPDAEALDAKQISQQDYFVHKVIF